MKNPIVLIDASSYFFRAYHALPPLMTSSGQATGAVYGVINMVKKLIKDYQPERIGVVFDAKGKTFRDDLYPEYKANRPPMPADLSSQFQPLIQYLQAMGLPLLIVDGVEADDVIGTLATQASNEGEHVLISTGDKDMAQLVNEHVTLMNTMNNSFLDIEGVKAKFSVTPEQIVDYLTLIGDTVDNVPGVNKCGPKTAVKWLEQYGSLENIIAHADDIGGKIGENLREAIPQLALSKALVTIKRDCQLAVSYQDLKPEAAEQSLLIELAKKLEFKSWLKEMLASDDTQTLDEKPISKLNYQVIDDEDRLQTLLHELAQQELICIDTETTSLDASQAELVGISVAYKTGEAFYLPFMHQDGSQQLKRDACLQQLKPMLENESLKKLGQNIKYDYRVFLNYNIRLCGIAFDSMLESYVLDSSANRHDMDSLSLKYLGHKTISFEEVAGKGAKQLRFDEIPLNKAAEYASEDADVTLKLHQKLYPMLDESLRAVFHEIEMPLVPVLADMERFGVLIDLDTLKKHGERLKERIGVLEKEAFQLADKVFNLNSTKQLQEILFEEQQLPVIAKTPKGQPSTAEAVLHELSLDYRLPAVILEFRSLSKLVSTYIDALPRRVNPKTGRVHTSYNQAVAATGRLSSSEPNLQNIPARTEEGRLIRTAFIASENKLLMAADYSQIELRIMAHLSKDEGLLKAFAHDLDIHAATASEIFQIPLEQVESEHRRRAKAVNFGLIYGMSSFGLAKQLGVSRQDAQSYIDIYFKRYPGVLEYMERTREQAHRLGYVETLFGRRLYLPEINSRNKMRQRAAERTAINAPMQGTAADIIKKAMIALADWQNQQSPVRAKMMMQVHDELVFEIEEEAVSELESVIRKLMEETVLLSVPLKVSIGTGKNWDEAH